MRPLIFCRPAQQALSCLRTPGSNDPTVVLSPRCTASPSASVLSSKANDGSKWGGVCLPGTVQNMQVRITSLYPLLAWDRVRRIIVMKDCSPTNWAKCGSGVDEVFDTSGGLISQRHIWCNIFTVSGLSCVYTHPNSNVDVVCIHLSPQVLADPLLAKELLEKLGAIFQVVATDSPLPRFSMLDAGGVVTCAPLHSPWAARFGKRMGQRSRGHCQQEGSLLEC